MSLSLRRFALRSLNQNLRRNPLLTRVLFGVKVTSGNRIHWDFTTLLLKSCLAKRARPGLSTLEVGCGPYALLSIYLAQRLHTAITACDVNGDYVKGAWRTVVLNSAQVEVDTRDLFAGLQASFDMIFFNAVYIPAQTGRSLGIDQLHEHESDWCGGASGSETIARFLREAPPHLKANGEVILGFNPHYLSEKLVLDLCRSCNYNLKERYRVFFNPSLVLILDRRSQ